MSSAGTLSDVTATAEVDTDGGCADDSGLMVVTIGGRRFGFRRTPTGHREDAELEEDDVETFPRAELVPPEPSLAPETSYAESKQPQSSRFESPSSESSIAESPSAGVSTATHAEIPDVAVESDAEPHGWTAQVIDCALRSRGWMISALVHGIAVVVLAMIVVAANVHQGEVIELTQANVADEFADVNVLTLTERAMSDDAAAPRPLAMPARLPEANSLVGDTPATLAMTSMVQDLPPGPVGDVLGLFGTGGHGTMELQANEGARFFGVQASGNRFVFVVDSSKSMIGPRWKYARRELLDTIDRLQPHQFFYVVFFDAGPHLMFDDNRPERAMAQATAENKRRLRRWMNRVDFGRFTSPLTSVQFAVELRPDAIFLLTDGEFRDRTDEFLRTENRIEKEPGQWAVETAVHTIGFQSERGQEILQKIAEENGGIYRYVP